MSGDTAWIMTSAALVLLMVPGLALFYGGMVRSKNVLNMLNMNFYCLGIVPIIWAVVGMSMANGDGDRQWLGFLEFGEFWMRQPDGSEPRDMATWAFLLTFAVITPALISGAVADRMKFSAWMIFVPVWSVMVYSPVGFWIYGGWAHALPAYDTAGGTRDSHQCGCGCVGTLDRDRQTPQLGQGSLASTQPPARAPRNRHVVVRLVRIQLGARRRSPPKLSRTPSSPVLPG